MPVLNQNFYLPGKSVRSPLGDDRLGSITLAFFLIGSSDIGDRSTSILGSESGGSRGNGGSASGGSGLTRTLNFLFCLVCPTALLLVGVLISTRGARGAVTAKFTGDE